MHRGRDRRTAAVGSPKIVDLAQAQVLHDEHRRRGDVQENAAETDAAGQRDARVALCTCLADVGQGPADVNGVQDLHGLVWEWVEDYSAMLVSADNRDQGDPDNLKFCGAGALSMDDRENYAVLMRVAMLSALQAEDTTANLGFRCARDLPGKTP